MKGKHSIKVRSRKIQFALEIERNITVIRGDSATGKTTLIGMLRDYEEQGRMSGVTVECDRPCCVLSGVGWEERLQHIENSIVFADEGNAFINSEAFAHAIRESNNYYVLITRESLYQLPYSVDAVLELRKTTSRYKRTYNRAYPYYQTLDRAGERLKTSDCILTEDSNSGYQMFSKIAEQNGTVCAAAQGKSNILTYLLNHLNEHTLVVADGAAFGAEMEKVYKIQQLYPEQVTLYLPESFEWLLLKSGIIRSIQLQAILDDPADTIDSAQFFSWEQFFTALLIQLTQNSAYMAYSKQHLPSFYLQADNLKKVMETIESR